MHRGTRIHERCVNTSVFLYKYMKCHMKRYETRKNIGNAICIAVFMQHEYDMKYENELKQEHEHEKQYVMNT